MAPVFSLISRIQDTGDSPANLILKLRIIRAYSQFGYGRMKANISSYEFVFHDRDGDRIHGSICKEDYTRMKTNFKEGELYAFQYFKIGNNTMRYKTTSNKFKFSSTSNTRVVHIPDNSEFPSYMFDFRQFSTLMNPTLLDETTLFDVIGKVDRIFDEREIAINNRQAKLVDVHIQDAQGLHIICTLWEEAADQIVSVFRDLSKHPLILVLQLARGKIFRGEVRVSNTYNITKMLLNEDIQEINDFKKSFSENSSMLNSITLSTLSGSSIGKIEEELKSGNHTLVTTKSLCEDNKVGTFWIHGKINSVGLNGTWYYISCLRCTRKVSKIGDKFFCDKCNNGDTTGSLRYKLMVRIVDETGDAKLLLWNKECVELIGITALELKTRVVDENESDEMPSEITSLVGRDVLFKVQIKDDYNSRNVPFNVVALNLDKDVISKYSGMKTFSKESAEPDLISLLATSDFIDEKHGSSEHSISTPHMELSTQLSDDKFDGMSLKRNLNDQFSTTMNVKKTKTIIKVEKDK